MAKTLNSKKLRDALGRVRNVGRAEEPVTIDGCSIVLQSLPPSAYTDVHDEIQDLDGADHINAYQMGFVCRSIVEIEGVDLREIQYIEDDVPDGNLVLSASVGAMGKAQKAKEALKELGIDLTIIAPEEGQERTVTLERHEWVRQRLSTWSLAAIAVAFRKFTDVVADGEEKAKERVQFKLPDESNEEKFRRLLTEAKEAEAEIPTDLVKKILEDVGYLQATTPEEKAEIDRRAREFMEEQQRLAAEERAKAVPPEPERPKLEPPAPPPPAPPPPQEPDLDALMRNRQPLNQTAANATVPMAPAQREVRVPPQIQAGTPERSAKIAALEAQVDLGLDQHDPQVPQRPQVAELSKPAQSIDGHGVKSILERPPAGGINPKFRRHT